MEQRDPEARRSFTSDETVREATKGCGGYFYDRIVIHPPFAQCSSRELFDAISEGWRECVDGPFHIRGCRLWWFTPSEACDLLADVGSLVL
jgi:hypothetical protein